MELDLEVCRIIAIRSGLPLQFIFKEFHLMNIASKIAMVIYSESNTLVLKGGTALNKVYIQRMQRFSEDLDFDLVSKDASRKISGFSKKLASTLKEYEIDEFKKIRNTVQFYCIYKTPLGGKDNVRVDISPKLLVTAKPIENREIYSEFTHSSVTGLKTYSIEDLTARKMNALASRSEGKDLYDVSMVLPLCSIKILRTAIGDMLKSEGQDVTITEFMNKMFEHLKKNDMVKLRNLTNPFIPIRRRPKDWSELRNNLLLELEGL